MKSITLVVQNLLKPYIDNHRHTAEANLAPVELDATSASASYAVGDKLVLNDVLYDVTAAITAGDALVDSGAGANIAASDDITTQIKNHTVTTDAVPTKNSTHAVQSGGVYSADVAMGGNLATVENESTVSQNYAIGAFFVRNNVRYKALTAITSGTSWSSLVLNTDYEVAPTISADNQTLTNLVGKKLAAQTLSVGSTTLTFSDASITSNSTVEAFCDVYGLAPTDITVTTGQAVCTFDAQQSAVSVYLMVINR